MSGEKELERLQRRFGAFERARFYLPKPSADAAGWLQKLSRRRGEIILVVPRGNGRVLLHTKEHYPEGVYRLLSGGIHPGEDPVEAARREAYEEIGLDAEPRRMLGILENVFGAGRNQYVYPSYVFVTQEFRGTPKPTDPDEPISGFEDADAVELRAVASELASLPGPWRDWGRFRANAHAWLADRLEAIST